MPGAHTLEIEIIVLLGAVRTSSSPIRLGLTSEPNLTWLRTVKTTTFNLTVVTTQPSCCTVTLSAQVRGRLGFGKQRGQSAGVDKDAAGPGSRSAVFRRRDTVLLLVRTDHPSDGRPSQLHGPGAGRDGRQTVPVHGDLGPGLDRGDRAAERRVLRAGRLGEDVVREIDRAPGNELHYDRVPGMHRQDWFVSSSSAVSQKRTADRAVFCSSSALCRWTPRARVLPRSRDFEKVPCS